MYRSDCLHLAPDYYNQTRAPALAVPTHRKPAPVARACGGKKIASSELRVRGGYASSTHRRSSLPDTLRKRGVLLRQSLAPLVPHRAVLLELSWQKNKILWISDPIT